MSLHQQDTTPSHVLDIDDFSNGIVSQMISNLPKQFPHSQSCENGILVYDSNMIGNENNETQKLINLEIIRALGMNGPGCVVVKNTFTINEMNEWNHWIQNEFQIQKQNDGFGKKKDHFSKDNLRIWHIPEKMMNPKPMIIKDQNKAEEENDDEKEEKEEEDPKKLLPQRLLVDFLTNNKMSSIIDGFLGQYHIGSLAVNEVIPNGKAQNTHTDYPPGFYNKIHIKNIFSQNHLENIMPYFSLQAGVAVTEFNKENGATEMIPFSHRIIDNDYNILPTPTTPINNDHEEKKTNKKMKTIANEGKGRPLSEIMEPFMITVISKLPKGSVIYFNRKLLHRGGENKTNKGRTAILLQAIMPFGVKMETVDHKVCMEGLDQWIHTSNTSSSTSVSSSAIENKMMSHDDDENKKQGINSDQYELLKYRFQGPSFPRDLDQSQVDEENS